LGGLLRAAGALVCALLFVSPAHSYTDGPRQLALRWPAQGTVTSPFGWDGGRPHDGLDIGILQSLEVDAAAPGVVTAAGYLPGYEGYGLTVIVRHALGWTGLYAHLTRAGVRPGDYVGAGQKLGLAGCTGWCTGTHLHFEVRYLGRPFDPRPLLSE
jgi:murein DD-endopeptidase MepM/ murein hydrolase activator NlpD